MSKPNHIIQAATVFDSQPMSDPDLMSLVFEAADEPSAADDSALPTPIAHWADRRRARLEASYDPFSGVVEEADLCVPATVVSSEFARYGAF